MPRRPDPIPSESSLTKVFRAAKRAGVRVRIEAEPGEPIRITTIGDETGNVEAELPKDDEEIIL